jgi:peptidyl-prolyl cis-trans isomerase D
MIKLIRSQSPILMVILLILISLSFVVFYNIPQLEGLRGSQVGTIAGRSLTLEEFKLVQQATWVSALLTSGEDFSNAQGDLLNRYTWQRALMLDDAQRLQLAVSDEALVAFIRKLPFLQKEGRFEPTLYGNFVKGFLTDRGISEIRFEQILREELILERWRQVMFSPVSVNDAEVEQRLQEMLGPLKISLVRLKMSDLQQAVTISPAELETEYQTGKPAYRTAELRKAEVVTFPFLPSVTKGTDKEKEAAKRAIGEKAADFAGAVAEGLDRDPEAFTKLAALQQLPVIKTDFFGAQQAPVGLPASPSFNRAVFTLTKDMPLSEVIETATGYLVAKLTEVQVSQPRPLAEVQSVVEQAVREQKQRVALVQQGEELAMQLQAEIEQKKSLSEAAKQRKLTVESPAAFTPAQPPATLREAQEIAIAARTLPLGKISPFIPTRDGGLIFQIEKREAVSGPLVATLRPRAQEQMLDERRSQVFADWLRLAEQRPGTVTPAFLRP